jgi:hypothetical protein
MVYDLQLVACQPRVARNYDYKELMRIVASICELNANEFDAFIDEAKELVI